MDAAMRINCFIPVETIDRFYSKSSVGARLQGSLDQLGLAADSKQFRQGVDLAAA
jgi:hypothetical protein